MLVRKADVRGQSLLRLGKRVCGSTRYGWALLSMQRGEDRGRGSTQGRGMHRSSRRLP